MDIPARIAVLASGGGTNLQALLDRFNAAESIIARVELVVGSRTGITALERATHAEVPAVVMNAREMGQERFTQALLTTLGDASIDLIVLAGYLQMIPGEVVERYRGRILNIHPALLPAFGGHGMYGLRVHRAVIESGARVSGATVHLVDERYDEGKILAQWPVPVLPGDTPESLAARILRIEHELLPAAVESMIARDTVKPHLDPVGFDLIRGGPRQESLRALNCAVHLSNESDLAGPNGTD